ncbi:hypothetical protein Tco_0413273 [Tanacetum coccineum]
MRFVQKLTLLLLRQSPFLASLLLLQYGLATLMNSAISLWLFIGDSEILVYILISITFIRVPPSPTSLSFYSLRAISCNLNIKKLVVGDYLIKLWEWMKQGEEWSTHQAYGLVITYLNQRGRKNFDLVYLLLRLWESVEGKKPSGQTRVPDYRKVDTIQEQVVNSDLLPTDGNCDAVVFNIVPNVLNIAKNFDVPFKTFTDIEDLMNGIEMGKHEAVWFTDENPSFARNVENTAIDTINEDTLHVDDSPIVQSVTIQDKPRSYVGVAGGSKSEPSKSKANFRSLYLEIFYEGANFSIPKKDVETPWFTIETVSMEYEWKPPRCDLCKLVLNHYPKKVPVPPTVVTPIVVTPNVEKTQDGFQTMGKKKKKGKSKSINGGQFVGHSIKQTFRYEPKATTSEPKKGVSKLVSMSKFPSMLKNQPPKVIVPSSKEDNIPMSKSYAALDEESDKDVENVYEESANLFHSTKNGGSLTTSTVAVGCQSMDNHSKGSLALEFQRPEKYVAYDSSSPVSATGEEGAPEALNMSFGVGLITDSGALRLCNWPIFVLEADRRQKVSSTEYMLCALRNLSTKGEIKEVTYTNFDDMSYENLLEIIKRNFVEGRYAGKKANKDRLMPNKVRTVVGKGKHGKKGNKKKKQGKKVNKKNAVNESREGSRQSPGGDVGSGIGSRGGSKGVMGNRGGGSTIRGGGSTIKGGGNSSRGGGSNVRGGGSNVRGGAMTSGGSHSLTRGGGYPMTVCHVAASDMSPPQDLEFERLSKIKIDRIREDVLSTQIPNPPVDLDTKKSDNDMEVIFDKELFLRERNTTHVTPQTLTYTPPLPFLATMEPLDTLLMGDENISITSIGENDEFRKSSVDDLVSIPRESEVTSVSTNLECSMPLDSPPSPRLDVLGVAKVDIDLPFREHLDTLLFGDREIDFNPSDLETIDPVPDPRMFNVLLGNDDLISRSFGCGGG